MQTKKIQKIIDAFDSCSTSAEMFESAYERRCNGCVEAIAVFLCTKVLIITARADDTIDVVCVDKSSFDSTGYTVNVGNAFRSLFGQKLFWGWATVNQQGYTDGVLLSCDDVFPRVCVSVVASSLSVFAMEPDDNSLRSDDTIVSLKLPSRFAASGGVIAVAADVADVPQDIPIGSLSN